jgi:hypothetical protein
MKPTANPRVRSLLLALACALSIPGCKTASTLPSIAPTAPEVRCKQPDTPPIAKAPRGDEWVDKDRGQLSERAAVWVGALLGTVDKEREYRRIEHACLDKHEKRGDIRQ